MQTHMGLLLTNIEDSPNLRETVNRAKCVTQTLTVLLLADLEDSPDSRESVNNAICVTRRKSNDTKKNKHRLKCITIENCKRYLQKTQHKTKFHIYLG